jgi:NAD(P)-dependent dehydrogenase (short-subunit alcohol dehydrogenase family)
MSQQVALIVGAGSGLSASLARRCAADGMRVGLAARTTKKLDALAAEIGARTFACDAVSAENVEQLFTEVENQLGAPDLVIYNPSARAKGSIVDLDPLEVEKVLTVTCFGGFLVAQQAAKSMLQRGHGSILFTGASASVKGYANSAPFAMGKFGLRGLAQSMARELAPKGIHVAHFVIDGSIATPSAPGLDPRTPDDKLDPDVIAANYLAIHHQHRSAWTWEVELRPWVEHF